MLKFHKHNSTESTREVAIRWQTASGVGRGGVGIWGAAAAMALVWKMGKAAE